MRHGDGAKRLNARINIGSRDIHIDLSNPVSLAIDLDFSQPQPRHFGAPPATARPFSVPGFCGSVEHGASCNCQILTLNPHCNGTHTECVGHLTREAMDAHRVAPLGLVPALLLSVDPVEVRHVTLADESTEPAPQAGDLLVTRSSLEAAWLKTTTPFEPRALIVRTLPNRPEKRFQDYSGQVPPYLSRQAAEWLVERRIEHLVVDLPSIDRSQDEGHLTAHRIFFGLPRGSSALHQATRPRATVTELAFAPDCAVDGPYLVELQVPALGGDAVPSRPLLYGPLQEPA
jgi:kynurenine formamidase